MSLSDHARTIDGLPLIGVNASATEERCDSCKNTFFLADIEIVGARLLCLSCRKSGVDPKAVKLLGLKAKSKKHAAYLQYGRLRRKYLLDHPICERCHEAPSTHLHHKRGRGRSLCQTDSFMACCKACEKWIHDHEPEALALGYLIPNKTGSNGHIRKRS